MKWWDRWPWALPMEEAALQAAGFAYTIDEDQRAKGRLVMRVRVPIAGEVREVTATYPNCFPYFAPAAQLRGYRYPRHHNLEGFLCLLERNAEDWVPGVDTLAGLLSAQLPKITSVNAPGVDSNERQQLEEEAGEPLANFLPFMVPPNVLLRPDSVPGEDHQVGFMEVFVNSAALKRGVITGEVRAFQNHSGYRLVSMPTSAGLYDQQMRGFWARLPSKPAVDSVLESDELRRLFWRQIIQRNGALENAARTGSKGDVIFAAAVYRDEVSWDDSKDDVVLMRAVITGEQTKRSPAESRIDFVRCDAAGERTFLQRSPSLAPLRAKSVLLIGAGNVGSPVAMQLARAGLQRLTVVDHDILQVGNTVRWALGRRFAGWHKALAIAESVRHDFPLTTVEPLGLHVGGLPAPDDKPNYDDLMRSRIQASDLVIDAAVHYGVSRYLADLCREMGKPLLWLSTTAGAAGGVVGRIVPGRTVGCWHCYQRSMADGTLPLPPEGDVTGTQPAGCTHPTFVGAGVDSEEIPVLASRLAIATLCRDAPGAYRDFSWDVAVCELQTEGVPHAPRWSEHRLAIHPQCEKCAINGS